MRRRALKPAVEALSEEAWQRIENLVFECLERPAGAGAAEPLSGLQRSLAERALSAAVPVAALALVLGIFALVIASRPGRIDELQTSQAAKVTSTERVGAPRVNRVTGNQLLAPDEHVAISSAGISSPPEPHVMTTAGPVVTELAPSLISIENHSDVRIEGDEATGWLVVLERGSVDLDVASPGGSPDFVVRAGDVTIRAAQTRFDVTRVRGSARIAVQEGRLRVERAGSEQQLSAGDSWPRQVDSRKRVAAAPPIVDSSAQARRRASEADRQKFERASQFEHTDPAGARARYRALSAAGGPWAANALYAEARLLLDQGRGEAAHRLLRHYWKRYPSGANAFDVQQLLSSIQNAGRDPRRN